MSLFVKNSYSLPYMVPMNRNSVKVDGTDERYNSSILYQREKYSTNGQNLLACHALCPVQNPPTFHQKSPPAFVSIQKSMSGDENYLYCFYKVLLNCYSVTSIVYCRFFVYNVKSSDIALYCDML